MYRSYCIVAPLFLLCLLTITNFPASAQSTAPSIPDSIATASSESTAPSIPDSTTTASSESTAPSIQDSITTASSESTIPSIQDSTTTASSESTAPSIQDSTTTASSESTAPSIPDSITTASIESTTTSTPDSTATTTASDGGTDTTEISSTATTTTTATDGGTETGKTSSTTTTTTTTATEGGTETGETSSTTTTTTTTATEGGTETGETSSTTTTTTTTATEGGTETGEALSTTTTTTTTTITAIDSGTDTTETSSTTTTTTTAIDSGTDTTETSSTTTTMTTTIGTTTTTTATMTPTPATSFNCTFSNKDCFDDPENITTIMNGSSYDEDMLNVTTVLPFPLSGANANRPSASGDARCQFPYDLYLVSNDTVSRKVSFCYKNKCWGSNNGVLNCTEDSYALIRLNPNESEKSISISPTTGSERDLKNAGTQKILEFYYYMGVYGLNKSNQQIVVQINENKELVATINALNQTPNEWTKFSHKIRSDTNKITFVFKTDNTGNNPNFFALDELSTRDETETTTPPPSNSNLGLILGLSLGLGIPLLLGVVGFILYFIFKHKREDTYLLKGSGYYDVTTTPNYDYYDQEQQQDISVTYF